MEGKHRSSRILRILAGIYLALYLFMFFIEPLIQLEFSGFRDEFESIGSEAITTLLVFLVFVAGFVWSWYNEKIAGIILLVWNALVWICALYIWTDAGMVLVLAVPVLPLGVFFIQHWYQTTSEPQLSTQRQWKLVLQLLMANYTVLYLLAVIDDVIAPDRLDFITMPGVLMIVVFIIFALGFLLSWKWPLLAGLLCILWYVIVLFMTVQYFEFVDRGPAAFFGVVILLQGILYLLYHFRFETKQT